MSEIEKKIVWRCPSNIAIVKYWGKRENQIPANSSVSMTLSTSYTEVELELQKKKTNDGIELEYYFEGKKNSLFEKRVSDYLEVIAPFLPGIDKSTVIINSKNSFPHSAGIASSASAFGAIALALYDAFGEIKYANNSYGFFQEVSRLARLGSGSACRSLFPGFSLWGANNSVDNSSDQYAVELSDIHDNFKDMQDSILLIDKSPKKVSSSVGHSLMKGHPYAKNRFKQANKRTTDVVNTLKTGNIDEFIRFTESEALTLHAMMMSSIQPYLLLKPKTLAVIDKIQDFRQKEKLPICFTLDAGPNVHVLYPAAVKSKVFPFLCEIMENKVDDIIEDKIGVGPIKLK